MKRCAEIHVPGATPERLDLSGETLTIDAASSAAFASGTEFTDQSIHLKVGADGVIATAEGANGLIFRGKNLREAMVPWGDEVYSGRARIAFLLEKPSGPNALVWLAVPLALMAGSFAMLGLSGSRDALPEVPPPQLFAEAAPCPEHAATEAAQRGEQARRLASFKEERSAFDLADGIGAVRLLQEAAQCFERAGNPEAAAFANAEQKRWASHVDEVFASLRLRLHVTVSRARYREALQVTRQLEALLTPVGQTPYVTWLNRQKLELERKVALAGG